MQSIQVLKDYSDTENLFTIRVLITIFVTLSKTIFYVRKEDTYRYGLPFKTHNESY